MGILSVPLFESLLMSPSVLCFVVDFSQYSVWNFIFIGWNAFLVCFYLNVGVLDRVSRRNAEAISLWAPAF